MEKGNVVGVRARRTVRMKLEACIDIQERTITINLQRRHFDGTTIGDTGVVDQSHERLVVVGHPLGNGVE